MTIARSGNDSFSTVIKETLVPASRTTPALLRRLDGLVVDEATLNGIERVVASRAGGSLRGTSSD